MKWGRRSGRGGRGRVWTLSSTRCPRGFEITLPTRPPRLILLSRTPLAMPAAAKHFAVPKPGVPRPTLPLEHANPHLRTSPSLPHPPHRPITYSPSLVDASKPPAVKFQEIVRDGQATVVRLFALPSPACPSRRIAPRLDGSRSPLYVLCHPSLRRCAHMLTHTDRHPARWSCFHPPQSRHRRDLRHYHVPCRLPHCK